MHLWEWDIDNAYWELNKEQVLNAVQKAPDLVCEHRRTWGGLSFSIAKANLHMLERLGEATSRNFRVFGTEEVLTFVRWDLYHNTLFEVWGTVLRQARKGVPIGGYLSAQLMCLWALVHENVFRACPTDADSGPQTLACIPGAHLH